MLFLSVASTIATLDVCAQAIGNESLVSQLQKLRATDTNRADVEKELKRIESDVPVDAPYALRRELAMTQLSVRRDSLGFEETLKRMQSLRNLAEANGDADTVNMMDIKRIYMSHADDDIGKFIAELNAVRARIRSDASPEVMEALERSYGNMYFDAGNFDTALRHQLAALDWAEKLPQGSVGAQLYRLGTIADLYVAMGLPDVALETVKRALDRPDDAIPRDNRTSLLTTRARALIRKGDLDDGETSLAAAEQSAGEDSSTFTQLRIATERAELQLSRAMPDKALETIDRIESLASKADDSYYLARSWMLRGHALVLLDRVDDGLALMQKATDYFLAKGQMVDVLNGLDRQVSALREKKLYGLAIERMQRRQSLWSELFRNERGRAIAEAEAQHRALQLEHRIEVLSTENRIQQQSLRAEQLGKVLAIVLALFAVTLCAFLYLAIRRARRERDKLSNVVRFDALTGAFSRYQFQNRIERNPGISSIDGQSSGLLLLDLDHFKAINDQHGHEAGDAVLKATVERIRRVLGKEDELYRWGGEEFLIVLNRSDAQALDRAVVRLIDEVENTPVVSHGHSMEIRVSGGYVRHPLAQGWEAPLADGIRWADAALYCAKNAGRRRVEKVELTESGRAELQGRRPIDMPQLLDWQRRGYLEVQTIQPVAALP